MTFNNIANLRDAGIGRKWETDDSMVMSTPTSFKRSIMLTIVVSSARAYITNQACTQLSENIRSRLRLQLYRRSLVRVRKRTRPGPDASKWQIMGVMWQMWSGQPVTAALVKTSWKSSRPTSCLPRMWINSAT